MIQGRLILFGSVSPSERQVAAQHRQVARATRLDQRVRLPFSILNHNREIKRARSVLTLPARLVQQGTLLVISSI